MTCSYCGTELPAGALFCGECGRAVGRGPVVPSGQTPDPAEASRSDGPEAGDVELCAQCSAALAPSDIFCPECGFVRRSSVRRHDTVVIEPIERDLLAQAPPPSVESPSPSPSPSQPTADEAPLGDGRPATLPQAPVPPPGSLGGGWSLMDSAIEIDLIDLEQTRIVGRSSRGTRFVLQFSTGESVSVFGTGLVGRNPIPEPGEFFDMRVPISDPGRSVSKTHLEFGQDEGQFWVSDRFSGNGTVVRDPDRQARRCDAGKRYRVARGGRVEIGEQFFIVS